jgi:hypothetical protein
MIDDQLKQAQDIIRQDPGLIWYTKSYDTLEERSIVEAVLNYGYRDQVEKLISIFGLQKTATIFRQLDSMPRNNLHPIYRNYYRLYFNRYAH